VTSHNVLHACPVSLFVVIASFDYEPQNDDELRFRENTMIYVIKKNSDGWWEGVMEIDGQPICGLFPANYVEPL